MTNHVYRWQDFVLPPRSVTPDLAVSFLVLGLLAGAVLGASHPAAGHPGSAAIEKAALAAEQAPPLADSAKRPVVPRRTEDWL